MFNILLYELNLLSGVDTVTLLMSSQILGLTLQQMKDFLLANGILPTSENVKAIFALPITQTFY